MKTPFFITGLPRTRTAWLANLFTTDSTLCFHSPGPKYLEIRDLIEASDFLRVGISDPILTLHHPGHMTRWPDAPWLYIEREEKRAADSLLRFTRGHVNLFRRDIDRWFALHQDLAADLKRKPRVLVLNFQDLDREETLQMAWSHLLPEQPWSPLRWQALRNLKVEENIARIVQENPSWFQT